MFKIESYGLYTCLPIPKKPWIDIFMNFILRLPRYKTRNDSIFIMVDRFFIIAHFIRYHKTNHASHVANLLFKEIIGLHGMPMTIVFEKK